jgi:hypothetical protein
VCVKVLAQARSLSRSGAKQPLACPRTARVARSAASTASAGLDSCHGARAAEGLSSVLSFCLLEQMLTNDDTNDNNNEVGTKNDAIVVARSNTRMHNHTWNTMLVAEEATSLCILLGRYSVA